MILLPQYNYGGFIRPDGNVSVESNRMSLRNAINCQQYLLIQFGLFRPKIRSKHTLQMCMNVEDRIPLQTFFSLNVKQGQITFGT